MGAETAEASGPIELEQPQPGLDKGKRRASRTPTPPPATIEDQDPGEDSELVQLTVMSSRPNTMANN
jgi:hypothetical protein